MGIQRWDRDEDDMHDHPEGDYVLFADHEQVVAELEAKLATGAAIAGAAMEQITSLAIERDALRAELAAKSKDAERYRWLTDPDFGRISISDIFNAWWRSDNGHPETINDAIDIAMKQDEAAMGEGNGR